MVDGVGRGGEGGGVSLKYKYMYRNCFIAQYEVK